jgi:hypothetical protein
MAYEVIDYKTEVQINPTGKIIPREEILRSS